MEVFVDLLEFVKSQSDKVLLTVLFCVSAHYVFRAENAGQTALAAWLQSSASAFGGALLALITGRWAGKNKNGNEDQK